MISETAAESLEDLRADGLEPTVRDIIRLNAMGLKLEAIQKKHVLDSTDYLPRVAAISPTMSFRQPTVGHEIWMDRVERICAKRDYQTILALKAFALSRPAKDLPDPDSPLAVKEAIETFCRDFQDVTRDQIYAAIDYVLYGANPSVGEYPPVDAREPDGSEAEDWKLCVTLGVLHEGKVALWGVNQAELEAMTRRQLEDAIRRAYIFHDIRRANEVEKASANYYSTLDEIRERLTKEKEVKDNG